MDEQPTAQPKKATRAGDGPEERLFVGWREWVSLPGLHVPGVKAKIDTGARTSALHATDMERYREGGRDQVRFLVHPLQRRFDLVIPCRALVIDARVVTPSSGHSEHRLVIRTPIKIGQLVWDIEITLTDRSDMRFRMLLGRQAMKEQRLLVDPGRSFLSGKRPRGLYRAPPP